MCVSGQQNVSTERQLRMYSQTWFMLDASTRVASMHRRSDIKSSDMNLHGDPMRRVFVHTCTSDILQLHDRWTPRSDPAVDISLRYIAPYSLRKYWFAARRNLQSITIQRFPCQPMSTLNRIFVCGLFRTDPIAHLLTCKQGGLQSL